MTLGQCTPIIRIFDVAKAEEFYLGFLGFVIDFQHRFEPDAPLYMGIARDGCRLHLSEHHGDASPGCAVRVAVDGIEAYHAELIARGYRYCRPGVEPMPWGDREMRVADPFGNRIVFFEST